MNQTFRNRPLPALTQFCINERDGIIQFPFLWFLVAVYYIVRGNATAFQLVAFSTTLILTLLGVLIVLIVGYTLPWVPIRLGSSGG